MHAIKKFCNSRVCSKQLTDAFVAYCRSFVSGYYNIGNGTTVTGILMSFTDAEVLKMWDEFIRELRSSLPQESVPHLESPPNKDPLAPT